MAESVGAVLEKMAPEKLDEMTNLAKEFASGRTLADIHGITLQDLEAVYSVAFNLYNNQRYDEAVKVFKFLCMHDHFQEKYWMGLGATHQMMKDFKLAASAYGYAYILDSDNPKPPLHAADCFMADGNTKDAESALNLVLELTKGDPEQHAAIRQRATVLMTVVKEKAAQNSASA